MCCGFFTLTAVNLWKSIIAVCQRQTSGVRNCKRFYTLSDVFVYRTCSRHALWQLVNQKHNKRAGEVYDLTADQRETDEASSGGEVLVM